MYENHPFRKKYLTRKYSGEKQDEFVYHVLAKNMKTNGYFLDFACGHPVDHNNTYLLEKLLAWRGLAIDNSKTVYWSQYRTSSKFMLGDVMDAELHMKIQENLETNIVDYISLDVDCAGRQLGHLAFQHVMKAGITFKCMTLEHESFKHGDLLTSLSRPMLFDKGYHLLFEDVSFEDGAAFEDWWINPEYINVKDTYKGLSFSECINELKVIMT